MNFRGIEGDFKRLTMTNNLVPESLPPNVFIGGFNQGKAQGLFSQFK